MDWLQGMNQVVWFPTSQYTRDKNLPSLEVFPGGNASAPDYQWEIWMPLKTE